VELERLQVSSRIVELVGENEDGSTGRTQDVGELLVPGSHAGRRIDDEEDEVGLLHRLTRLRRDLWAERPGVGAVDAAGVDQAEGGARAVAEELLAVPCDAGRLVDDGRTRRCQPVYERRLADVGEADDRDRAGDLDVVDRLVHVGGVASRGRPSSWIVPSHSHSLRISRSIWTEASLYPFPPRGRPSKLIGSPHATVTGRKVPRRHSNDPRIAAQLTGTSSLIATIAAPGCTSPGTPERCRVPSTNSP